jgi:superfamily II DNA or RNA helicase
MSKVFISKFNETYIFVTATNPSVEGDLAKYFSFYVPGYRFMPAYKNGMWDGKIKLYDRDQNLLYAGLFDKVVEFCNERGHSIEYGNIDKPIDFSNQDALKFINSLKLPKWIELRDYQVEAFASAVRAGRQTILSPTGSGKSFIIYLLYKYYNTKTLLVVNRLNLIQQMTKEINMYHPEDIHQIYSGQEKDTDKQLVITTWQSIRKMPSDWYNQFELIMVDETHGAKSKELSGILERAENVKNRFGLTGTLDNKKAHTMVIEGLLGPVNKVTTTSQLIEEKTLAELDIKCLVLNYPESSKKSKWIYQEEIDFICSSELRNKFIVDLVNKTPGNNIVLFQFIEKHGDKLDKLFKETTTRPYYYVHGKSPKELKENITEIMEKETNAIFLASQSLFGVGTNIKLLNNIFFASPSKARIKTLQAIGRVLRTIKNIKTKARLFDIADDLKLKSRPNYGLLHFYERIKMYKDEKHPYQIHNIRLQKNDRN